MASCQTANNKGEITLTLEILGQNETSQFAFNDVSLLEILENKYDVEISNTLYTGYIKCIDDVCANDEYSWVYYANGKPLNLGVDVYKVQDGDKILFTYKKV